MCIGGPCTICVTKTCERIKKKFVNFVKIYQFSHFMNLRLAKIKDKALIRWCNSFRYSVGYTDTVDSIEELCSDGWTLVILLGL